MIVHANVYDPSARSLFKSKASDKAKCQTIDCSNHENCDLYKRGECAIRAGLFGGKCPYGKWNVETGYTRRARTFRKWIRERREQYKDIPFLNVPKKLATVGEFVYLPYSHMDKNAHLFSFDNNLFVPLVEFTAIKIKELCEYRPQAIFGVEIASYQIEVVPKFVLHLSEVMPVLYEALTEIYPRAAKILTSHSNIGRKAILSTVKPNVGVLTGIHDDDWIWDGEYLTMTNKQAGFALVKHSEVRIKPVEGVTVKICSDNQVNDETIFVD